MKLLLSTTLFFFTFYANAQKIDTVWYNQKWEKTNEVNARHYLRTIRKIGENNYAVADFYETKAKQMEGHYASLNPEIKNGDFTYWYRNGKIQMEASYEDNRPTKVLQFNENGDVINQWELIEVMTLINGQLQKERKSIEKAPKFPGGAEGLNAYISKSLGHLKTPGKLNVQFKVNSDGTVSEVMLLDSVSPSIDKEAIRVIKKMPRWEPGRQNGKSIAVILSIPISFNQ